MTAHRDVVRIERLEREVEAQRQEIGALTHRLDALQGDFVHLVDELEKMLGEDGTPDRAEKKRVYMRDYMKRKRAEKSAPQVVEAS